MLTSTSKTNHQAGGQGSKCPVSKWDKGTGYLEPHGVASLGQGGLWSRHCAGLASSQFLSSGELQRLRCQKGPPAPSSSDAGLAQASGGTAAPSSARLPVT